jgi:hypothetical protein
MATKSHQKDLLDRLRAGGVRKRAAQTIAEASDGRRKHNKRVRGLLKELGKLVDNAEDQIHGGPAKRSAAAKKAAATRKRNAAKGGAASKVVSSAKRSAAAKKGAKTKAQT